MRQSQKTCLHPRPGAIEVCKYSKEFMYNNLASELEKVLTEREGQAFLFKHSKQTLVDRWTIMVDFVYMVIATESPVPFLKYGAKKLGFHDIGLDWARE